MLSIRDNYLVKKRNILNETRYNMTLQELRFFTIYLAKINPENEETRIVCFPLGDFQDIMELGRVNVENIKAATDSLLGKVISVPLEKKGNYVSFQLFKECKVFQDDRDKWFVQIDAHDKALPLMFDFKEKYFSYQLWNALSLKSVNQLRMYEILKQYEKIGYRVIELDKLKELLGLTNNEYERWSNFKRFVLDSCKDALEENTDIKFTYEPYGKRGRGGKIFSLKFTIIKNNKFKGTIRLDDFIENNDTERKYDNIDWDSLSTTERNTLMAQMEYDRRERLEKTFEDKNLFNLAEACKFEFDEKEMTVLYNMALKIAIPKSPHGYDISMYDYFKSKHDELEYRASQTKITKRFGYIKKLFELDMNDDEY